LPGVQILEKRGAGKGAAAKVENEIDQCVELDLLQFDRNGSVDIGRSRGHIAREQVYGLILRNGQTGCDSAACVAIADGPYSDLILICDKPAPLELLREGESIFAVSEIIHTHTESSMKAGNYWGSLREQG
jgi:hypothetical protein